MKLKLPHLPKLPQIAPPDSRDVVFALGLLVFSIGLSLWQLPAGFIGGGFVLMLVSAAGVIRR